MNEIKLTNTGIALVDDEDFEFLSRFNWWSESHNKNTYAVTRQSNSKVILYMHHFLLPKRLGYETDHKDGNGLNNQKANLRWVTHAQNSYNRGPAKNNGSGYKGVYWYPITQKWVAQIIVNSKKHHLGYFKSVEKAAEAYNTAARRFHGEFAFQNKITLDDAR